MKLSNIIYFSKTYYNQLHTSLNLLLSYAQFTKEAYLFQSNSLAHKVHQQMLLLGGKMQAIKDYDYDLNYILFSYRSLNKRKFIKPFLTLMRELRHNKQQFDPQSVQNRELITPFTFLGKQIEKDQNAKRVYNQQQTEDMNSNNSNRLAYQQSEGFLHKQLQEIVDKFGLYRVEKQEQNQNVASNQKEQIQSAQNINKMLFELSQNDHMLSTKNVEKQGIQEFRYILKRAINDQNLQMKFESHARSLSEQKQKEPYQQKGNWSDLRSNTSNQNTTQSERKLKITDSSPQYKQGDDNTEKIQDKQISCEKDIQILENKESLKKISYRNTEEQTQINYDREIKHYQDSEHRSQFYSMAHQNNNQVKFLEPIRQSQNEVYQAQIKYDNSSSKNSIKNIKIMKTLSKRNRLENQHKLRQENETLFNQEHQYMERLQSTNLIGSQNTKQSISKQSNATILQKNNQIIQQAEINYQQTNFYPNNQQSQIKDKMNQTRKYRPTSFIQKNKKKSTKDQIHIFQDLDKYPCENHQLQTKNKEIYFRSTNTHSQQDLKLQSSRSSKNTQIVNQQYGKKSKGPQLSHGTSYANSFKKQKQRFGKQKIQEPKTKNKRFPQKMPKKNIKKLQNKKDQNIIFQVIQVKDSAEQQYHQQSNIKNEYRNNQQQEQCIIRSQPLKRQSKNQDLIKSASHLQNYHKFNQQNAINDGKQNSHIKTKSISGTKSQQQYNLLKLMGGSDHLKQLSSLVIQQKQSCFQIEKQQLAQFMAVNSISIKSGTSYDESEDISFNSSTFRFTPNNLTSFNLEDALQEDSKRVNLNQLSQKHRKQLSIHQKTEQNATQDEDMHLNEENENYQPLFANYKKFQNNIDQLQMAVIQQLQSNKIMSSRSSHAQVQSRTYQDYRNHFNPKRALSRIKQQRGISQIKKQNNFKHYKQYQSLSPSKRSEGVNEAIKTRWEKNAQRFKTKMYIN